jgi:hypothetical protein
MPLIDLLGQYHEFIFKTGKCSDRNNLSIFGFSKKEKSFKLVIYISPFSN